jgi:hypothetical protein
LAFWTQGVCLDFWIWNGLDFCGLSAEPHRDLREIRYSHLDYGCLRETVHPDYDLRPDYDLLRRRDAKKLHWPLAKPQTLLTLPIVTGF